MQEEIRSLFVIIAFIALGMLAVWLITRLVIIGKEGRVINMELGRTAGAEHRHWQREKRRLWLTLLPFDQTLSRLFGR